MYILPSHNAIYHFMCNVKAQNKFACCNHGNSLLKRHSTSMSPYKSQFPTPSPPCHPLSSFHHPNSDKLFELKLSESSLGLCLTENIQMPNSHRKATEKQNQQENNLFVFKTSNTVISKIEKFQITVHSDHSLHEQFSHISLILHFSLAFCKYVNTTNNSGA